MFATTYFLVTIRGRIRATVKALGKTAVSQHYIITFVLDISVWKKLWQKGMRKKADVVLAKKIWC